MIKQRAFFLLTAPRRYGRALLGNLPAAGAGLAVLLLSGMVLYLASPFQRGLTITNDSGIFLYFGRRILAGDLPFRDLWDHKPPLVFYLNALGLWLGNGSTDGVWLLEYLALAASGLLGLALLRRFYRPLPAALAVTGALGSLVFLLEGGNLTEEFALPFQFGALYLFSRSAAGVGAGHPRRGVDPYALGVGVLLGLAFSLKQTMIGVGAALFVYLLARWIIQKETGLWRFGLWAALGFAVVQAGWVAYFAARGALGDYWGVAFRYNFLYSAGSDLSHRLNMLRDLANFLLNTSGFFTFALLSWAAGVVALTAGWMRGRRGAPQPVVGFPLVVALIDLPLELALISTSGYNFRHYFMPLLPCFAILAAWSLDALWSAARRRIAARGHGRLAGAAGALAAAALFFGASIPQSAVLAKQRPDLRLLVTTRYIKDHTAPEDFVLLWGTKVNINFLANRAAPTRYAHQKPLFQPGYAGRAVSEEFLRDLQTRPPALIINTRQKTFPVFAGGPNGPCRPDVLPIPEGMDAVYEHICANYRLETTLTGEGWDVYRYQP